MTTLDEFLADCVADVVFGAEAPVATCDHAAPGCCAECACVLRTGRTWRIDRSACRYH